MTNAQYLGYVKNSTNIYVLIGLSYIFQGVTNLSAMREIQVHFLGWEDPLEDDMANHSSILACRIPWTEELGGLQSTGRKESDTTEQLQFQFLSCYDNNLFHLRLTFFKLRANDFTINNVSCSNYVFS